MPFEDSYDTPETGKRKRIYPPNWRKKLIFPTSFEGDLVVGFNPFGKYYIVKMGIFPK